MWAAYAMNHSPFHAANAMGRDRRLNNRTARSSAHLIPPINDILGLLPTAPITEIACAAEKCSQTLFGLASRGDAVARRKLIVLHIAHLYWAYACEHSTAL